MERQQFKENVILVDADYLDSLAGDMRRNFSQFLGRQIPEADLAEWLVCAALDGGISEDEKVKQAWEEIEKKETFDVQSAQEVQVVFVRSLSKTMLQHFVPANLLVGIDGQAFRDPFLGEFLISVVPEEKITGQDEPLFAESARYLQNCSDVKRLILVPNLQKYGSIILGDLEKAEEGASVVILSMQPEEGRGFRSEMLGYSLMHAFGIAPEELK